MEQRAGPEEGRAANPTAVPEATADALRAGGDMAQTAAAPVSSGESSAAALAPETTSRSPGGEAATSAARDDNPRAQPRRALRQTT